MSGGHIEIGKGGFVEIEDSAWMPVVGDAFTIAIRISIPTDQTGQFQILQKGPLCLTFLRLADGAGAGSFNISFVSEAGYHEVTAFVSGSPTEQMTVVCGFDSRRAWITVNGGKRVSSKKASSISDALSAYRDMTLQIGGLVRNVPDNLPTNEFLSEFECGLYWILVWGHGKMRSGAIMDGKATLQQAMKAAGGAAILAHYDFTAPKPTERRHRRTVMHPTWPVTYIGPKESHRVFCNQNGQELAAGRADYKMDPNSDFTIMAQVSAFQYPTLLIGCKKKNAWNDLVRGAWSLDIDVNSTLELTVPTSDGKVMKAATPKQDFLYGQSYSVWATREGKRIRLYVDGTCLYDQVRSDAEALNMSLADFYVGGEPDGSMIPGPAHGCPRFDYHDQDLRRYATISNVGLWSRALSKAEMHDCAFGAVKTSDEALLAFWPLVGTVEDVSDHNCALRPKYGSAWFQPRIRALWCNGMNGHHFVQFAVTQDDAAHGTGEMLQAEKSFDVASGCPGFYMSIIADEGVNSLKFPKGAQVYLYDPQGTAHGAEADTENTFIMTEDGFPQAVVMLDPMPGRWWIEVACPDTSAFTLRLESIPSKNVAETSMRTLANVLQNYRNPFAQDMQHMESQSFILAGALLVAGLSMVVTLVNAELHDRAGGAVSGGVMRYTDASMQDSTRIVTGDDGGYAGINDKFRHMAGYNNIMSRILLMDAAVEMDKATLAGHDARSRMLYPVVNSGKFKDRTTKIIGRAVKRDKVFADLKKLTNGLVSANGHGMPQELLGWYKIDKNDGVLETVLNANSLTDEEVAGKIFHLFACNCGKVRASALGARLVERGALAFFGYSDVFQLPDASGKLFNQDEADLLVRCDIEIDIALLEGATCDEAYRRAYDRFTRAYQDNIQSHYALAMALKHNRDNLVAPKVNTMFGDGSASLMMSRWSSSGDVEFDADETRHMVTE